MSGSNSFHPFPTRRETISCYNICITTVLVNPNASILNKLKVSDILAVEVEPDVIKATYGGQEVGSVIVVSPDGILERLAECIEEGIVYWAEIIELDKENEICKVKIQAKRL